MTGKKTISQKRLRIFESPKQAEDEMLEYWASLSPVERLRQTIQLIRRVYSLQPPPDPVEAKRITFRKRS